MMNSARSYEAAIGSSVAREMERLDLQRTSLANASSAMDVVGRQVRELAESSALAQMKAMQSPAAALAQHYQDLQGPGASVKAMLKAMQSPATNLGLMGPGASAQAMLQAFQDAERERSTRMRTMFDSMADVRKGLLNIGSAHQSVTELMAGRIGMTSLLEKMSGVGSFAKMMAKEAEESRARTKRLLESASMGTSARRLMEDVERINSQWRVPGDALGLGETLRRVQEQFRSSVALPTIDWTTAATLAGAMGPEGLQEQLALLGIAPDGSLREQSALPERGILSRSQNEAIALMSLLLSILFFIYQEYSNGQQQAKSDALIAAQSAKLDAQAEQLKTLITLVGKALEQAAKAPEERYVVRKRPAAIRSKPQHGATVDGQLMPNEVVRAIDKDGKWVEVEYYHWLDEEYRTGWVLKKYLERVPVNYSADSK